MGKRHSFDELIAVIPTIPWFEKSGSYRGEQNTYAIHSLNPDLNTDAVPESWNWLPTTWDQRDPFHDSDQNREQSISHIKAGRLQAVQVVLVSLRRLPEHLDKFTVGNNNLLPAVKGAALYAFRMAATEALTESWSHWSDIVSIYENGFWPCGITVTNKVVVF